jgi:drug/metabolite transporter (DMT)-like permease
MEPGRSAQDRERFHLSGYLLVAGAAVCWAFGAALAKLLFARDMDPLTLAQVRAAFSFLALLLAAVAWRPAMLRVPWRLAGELAVLGIAGIAASAGCAACRPPTPWSPAPWNRSWPRCSPS